ncbi:MAG: hypothetical protein HYZ57_12455 [Acidobacteria bacterium]|nr:hypothetical protein [Acidobacteriota bacterium]MBI3280641.1 hypothetical protein [Acidobacteriota bacterium]
MATLANWNFLNRFSAAAAAQAVPQTARAEVNHACRLRALPNEDVYFFVKRIDNSRVVRQADPRAHAQSWKVLGATCLAALLLMGTLLPSAYGLFASYQLHKLQQEQQRLITEQGRLEIQEANLLSPQRLQELADMQEFIDPTPERVIYLPPKEDGSLALNRQ